MWEHPPLYAFSDTSIVLQTFVQRNLLSGFPNISKNPELFEKPLHDILNQPQGVVSANKM